MHICSPGESQASRPRKLPRPLVLASTSPHRRALLSRLAVEFTAADPPVDEAPYQERARSAETLVRTLAEAKARALVSKYPLSLIIGADQCAELDGAILGKPGTVQGAVEQLERMAGRTHRLVTGVCVLDASTGHSQVHVDIHRLTLRPLTRSQIERYVQLDEPLWCAGSYKIESLGVALFERIEGHDSTAVIGLPLMRLTQMLANAGIDMLGC